MERRFTVVLSALLVNGLVFAQNPKPTCDKCSASYIPKSEIDAYLKRADGAAVADQQMRAVNAGRSNIAVGVVYRGKLDKPANQSVAEHDQVSEVYHVLDGAG